MDDRQAILDDAQRSIATLKKLILDIDEILDGTTATESLLEMRSREQRTVPDLHEETQSRVPANTR